MTPSRACWSFAGRVGASLPGNAPSDGVYSATTATTTRATDATTRATDATTAARRPRRPHKRFGGASTYAKALPVRMRASTIAIVVGVVLFVLPVPGTFVAGGLVVLAGVVARLLGS